MRSYDFNTVAGITKQIREDGLAGLNAVIQARHAHYRKYNEIERHRRDLGTFVILGRFVFDSCANVGKIDKFAYNRLGGLPHVIGMDLPIAMSMGNFHSRATQLLLDTLTAEQIEEFRYDDVEKTHRELCNRASSLGYNFGGDSYPPSVEQTCPCCDKGWDLDNCHDLHVQRGSDDAWIYYHNSCWLNKLENDVKAEFEQVLENAGLTNYTMVLTPNQYGSLSYRGPWWVVEWKHGEFRIGWRKRVIDIAWDGELLQSILSEDNTTKSLTNIHAWSYEKATEYIKTLLSRINPVRNPIEDEE